MVFVMQGEDRREYWLCISKGFNAVWRKSHRFKLYGFIGDQYHTSSICFILSAIAVPNVR